MNNVYQSYPQADYSGGVVLVAAKSQKEAQKLLDKCVEDLYDRFDLSEPKLFKGLKYDGESKVIEFAVYAE